jgi:demethylmenaquinone methyltransferase/2-methoxy-6-polyprenyl-1,4-benzoquinol methylase
VAFWQLLGRQYMSTTLKIIKEAYDRAALLYDVMNRVYFLGRDQGFRSTLIRELALKPYNVVLNVCCGTGLDFPILRQELGKNGTIVGVDLSTQMLYRAKKKTDKRIALVRADIAHLPFRDQIFDAAIVTFCLKITPNVNLSTTELARILKDSGKIGVLANHKPHGVIKKIFAKIIGGMAKIDFELDLEKHLSKSFTIDETKLMYADLVQMIVGGIPDIA